jgi:hypothetical protein
MQMVLILSGRAIANERHQNILIRLNNHENERRFQRKKKIQIAQGNGWQK